MKETPNQSNNGKPAAPTPRARATNGRRSLLVPDLIPGLRGGELTGICAALHRWSANRIDFAEKGAG